MERLVFTDTMWVKKFAKFALSGTVFEIQAFLCFAIFAKNSKWPPFLAGQKIFVFFWPVKYLLKLGTASLRRYPVGQKFC